MLIFKIFIAGVGLLLGAIVLNGIAKFLGLPTWYDFFAKPQLTLISFFWLFIMYPLGLGGLVFILSKLFNF
jgi:hypothetical protein